jgi:hypothetical protein
MSTRARQGVGFLSTVEIRWIFDAHQKALKDFRPNILGIHGQRQFSTDSSETHRKQIAAVAQYNCPQLAQSWRSEHAKSCTIGITAHPDACAK